MSYTELMKLYHRFFSQFCPAFQENYVITYDEKGNEIPTPFPYLTYQVIKPDEIESVSMQVSIYTKSNNFKELGTLVEKLEKTIGTGVVIDKSVIIHKGIPFAQNMNDLEDKTIKRAVINLIIS